MIVTTSFYDGVSMPMKSIEIIDKIRKNKCVDFQSVKFDQFPTHPHILSVIYNTIR